MPTPHRKTRTTFDIPGDVHFITFSTFQRKPLLTKERSCLWMVDAIELARTRNPFDLWAWVIMPEHVHVLAYPHPQTKIANLLKSMKQSVSKRAINWLKRHSPMFLKDIEDRQPNGKTSHRFWQRGGGYDRNLRSIRDIHEKIDYIHNNPVNRGLVSRLIDYRWSSANAWKNGNEVLLSVDRSSVPTLTRLDDQIDSRLFR